MWTKETALETATNIGGAAVLTGYFALAGSVFWQLATDENTHAFFQGLTANIVEDMKDTYADLSCHFEQAGFEILEEHTPPAQKPIDITVHCP